MGERGILLQLSEAQKTLDGENEKGEIQRRGVMGFM